MKGERGARKKNWGKGKTLFGLSHNQNGLRICVILNTNKTIGDGGITVDFGIIKVHSFPLDHRIPGIIKFLWIIKVHTFICNDP